jgi:probable FeS assembly SUF system protein SufT
MNYNETPIILARDCLAVMIPSGEKISLLAGSSVWITQAHGGSCTVMTDRGYMVRIDGRDADALGMASFTELKTGEDTVAESAGDVEKQVWDQLRSCFDPEIPVNIVDLGLVYRCSVAPLSGGGYSVVVRFTLTAQGCGMGEFFKKDICNKLLEVPGIREIDVELVWDPPWNQSMISGTAKQQLGME